MRITLEALKQILTEGRVEDAKRLAPDVPEETIDLFVQSDPTTNNKYLQWMAQQAQAGTEPKSILAAVTDFHTFSEKFGGQDIYAFDNIEDLSKEIAQRRSTPSKSQIRKRGKSGTDVLYDDNDYTVYRILNVDASCKYGAETTWCISRKGNTNYRHYSSQNSHFFFIIKKNPVGKEDKKRSLRIIPDVKDMHSITSTYHKGLMYYWNIVEYSKPSQMRVHDIMRDLETFLGPSRAKVMSALTSSIKQGKFATKQYSDKEKKAHIINKAKAGDTRELLEQDDEFFIDVVLSLKRTNTIDDAIRQRFENNINNESYYYVGAQLPSLSDKFYRTVFNFASKVNRQDIIRYLEVNSPAIFNEMLGSMDDDAFVSYFGDKLYRDQPYILPKSIQIHPEHLERLNRALPTASFKANDGYQTFRMIEVYALVTGLNDASRTALLNKAYAIGIPSVLDALNVEIDISRIKGNVEIWQQQILAHRNPPLKLLRKLARSSSDHVAKAAVNHPVYRKALKVTTKSSPERLRKLSVKEFAAVITQWAKSIPLGTVLRKIFEYNNDPRKVRGLVAAALKGAGPSHENNWEAPNPVSAKAAQTLIQLYGQDLVGLDNATRTIIYALSGVLGNMSSRAGVDLLRSMIEQGASDRMIVRFVGSGKEWARSITDKELLARVFTALPNVDAMRHTHDKVYDVLSKSYWPPAVLAATQKKVQLLNIIRRMMRDQNMHRFFKRFIHRPEFEPLNTRLKSEFKVDLLDYITA